MKKMIPNSLCFLFIVIIYLLVVFAVVSYGGLFLRDYIANYKERVTDIPIYKAFLDEDCSPDDQIRKSLTNLCYQRATKLKQEPYLHAFFDTLEVRGFCTDESCSLKKFGKNALSVVLWTLVIVMLTFMGVGLCLFQRKNPNSMDLPFHLVTSPPPFTKKKVE